MLPRMLRHLNVAALVLLACPSALHGATDALVRSRGGSATDRLAFAWPSSLPSGRGSCTSPLGSALLCPPSERLVRSSPLKPVLHSTSATDVCTAATGKGQDKGGLRAWLQVRGGQAEGRWGGVKGFVLKNFLLLGLVASVSLARLNPSVGRVGGPLRPELTVNTLGVCAIFFLTGLSLKLQELRAAVLNLRLNATVQAINLGLVPALVAALTPFWKATGLKKELIDGLIIVNCLPCTINMAIVLSGAAGANLACAVFNCVLSNALGIVVTPLLILWALGSAASVQYVTVVKQLVAKVLVPVAIGQGLRAGSSGLRERVDSPKAKLWLKLTTESVLVLIIYTTFCQAFVSGLGLSGRDLWLLLAIVPSLHLCLLALSWAIIRSLGVPRDQQIAAMYVGAHKTLAFGVPLIKTIFETSPSLALYTAPLLLLHPAQLVLGSALTPFFAKYIKGDKRQ